MRARIRSIVAGVVETRHEDPLLAPAVELAERLDALLHVVHAFSFPDAVLIPLETVAASASDELVALRQEKMAGLESRMADLTTRATTVCHAVVASPAEAILDMTEQERAGLVLVGASRRGAVAGALLGTTAQRVVRGSRAPVLVKRRPAGDGPRRILMATDLSEVSGEVHEQGVELVKSLWDLRDAEVRSLHVGGDDVLLPAVGYQFAMQNRAKAKLDDFLNKRRSRGLTVEGKVRLGLSAAEILTEAEEWSADLVVLGTQGRRGLSRFMIGSVAERVSRKAQCDVLMIPAPAGPEPEREADD